MSATEGLFPPYQGLLPIWLLILSLVSFLSAVQNFRTLSLAQQLYNANPEKTYHKPIPKGDVSQSTATALSARTFGTWTVVTGIIRFYAAYNIDHPVVYKLALSTFLIAFGHFTTEWLVFKTAKFNSSIASPLFVSSSTTIWMLAQWSWYVQ